MFFNYIQLLITNLPIQFDRENSVESGTKETYAGN